MERVKRLESEEGIFTGMDKATRIFLIFVFFFFPLRFGSVIVWRWRELVSISSPISSSDLLQICHPKDALLTISRNQIPCYPSTWVSLQKNKNKNKKGAAELLCVFCVKDSVKTFIFNFQSPELYLNVTWL